MSAVFPVEPHERLVIVVGGAGAGVSGGYSGGAAGGTAQDSSGYGGGGDSDVRAGHGRSMDRRLVAGGGGGAGGLNSCTSGYGGKGGKAVGGSGGDGEYFSYNGGGGGGGRTQKAGGAGGSAGYGTYGSGGRGEDGSLGNGGAGGGNGRYFFGGGGGGGGGYYGGGGGGEGAAGFSSQTGAGGGGGGGSSFVVPSAGNVKSRRGAAPPGNGRDHNFMVRIRGQMKRSTFSRCALSGVAAAMLAGCSGSEPPIGGSGRNVVRSSRTHSCASCASHGERRVVRRPSLCCDRWRRVRPFVSERKVVGRLGVEYADNLCSDKAGDVFVVQGAYETVLEYSHRGKLLQTLQTYDVPQSCSVDPTTGNLAVPTVDYSCVYIYPNARPPAQSVCNDPFAIVGLCAYDSHGNLFLDGAAGGVPHHSYVPYLAELPKGSATFHNYALGHSVRVR